MSDALLDRLELCGPYRLTPARLAMIRSDAAARQWPVLEFAPSQAVDRETWLREFGQALNFPAYFGANFDALYDCLCDPEVVSQPALILVLADTRALDEEGTDTLIAVLQAASDEWRAGGRRLWSLFTAPGLDLDPLPAA